MDQLLSTGEGNLDTSNIPAFVQTSNKEEALNRLDSEVVNLNHILEILNQLPNWAIALRESTQVKLRTVCTSTEMLSVHLDY